MKPTREETYNFLKKELKDIANIMGTVPVPGQDKFDDVGAKKIKYGRNR